MKKERKINVDVELLKASRGEEVINEVVSEYAETKAEKAAFVTKFLTGELDGIMDDYAEAFTSKIGIRVTDADTDRLISNVKVTIFGVEDLSFFIKDIESAMENVSENYSQLFSVLAALGYNYQTKGFILPNLAFIDDMTLTSFAEEDINIVIDSVISAVGKIIPKQRTDRVMIACCFTNDTVREVLDSRFFLSLNISDLMIRIIDLQDMGNYAAVPETTVK